MKFLTAGLEHLDAINEINAVIDYGDPESFMRENIKAGRVIVCCHEQKQAVFGYCLYQEIWGNTLFLALVKVLPEYQGNGVGSRLIKTFESVAKKSGYTKYLSSTEKKNILSQKFHAKFGFSVIGSLAMPHGEEIFFEKSI